MYYVISVDLEDSQLLAKKTGEENSALKSELGKAQETITEKSGMVIDLQGKDVKSTVFENLSGYQDPWVSMGSEDVNLLYINSKVYTFQQYRHSH